MQLFVRADGPSTLAVHVGQQDSVLALKQAVEVSVGKTGGMNKSPRRLRVTALTSGSWEWFQA